MKKQLIIIISVFLVAILLFVGYAILKPTSDIDQTTSDDSYTLADDTASAAASLANKYTITFDGRETDITTSVTRDHIYMFAKSLAAANGNISIEFNDSKELSGVTVTGQSGSKTVKYSDFYLYLDDGTAYATNAESTLLNMMLELDGKETVETHLFALDGYDTDGDTTAGNGGNAFLFPKLSRDDIQTLTINNKNGTYKVIRKQSGDSSSLVFAGAEFVGYDKEKFSQLVVNATYVLSAGKVKDHKGFAEYGLEEDGSGNGSFTLVTTGGAAHKVIIGKLDPSGKYYYARYVGKDHVYLLPAADLNDSLLLPVGDYLTALLVYPITQTQDISSIHNIVINWFDSNVKLNAKQFSLISLSSNAAPYQLTSSDGKKTDTEVATLLSDKKMFTGTYSTWNDGSLFAGIKSSDKNEFYVDVCLINYATDGKYRLEFGMLRDESTGAYLPESMRVAFSTDRGETFKEIETTVAPSQSNKEYKKYTLEFESAEAVQYVRLYFTAPAGKYIVMDEIKVFAGDVDCQPVDALTGSWSITDPISYIPEGKNFVYTDSSNFQTTFLQSIGTLVGDKVVRTGICDDPTDVATLSKSALAEYGLDAPDMAVSFEFDGWRSTVYLKQSSENGTWYAYSVIKSLKNDDEYCTDIVAKITTETAEWLPWDVVDYIDHNLLSMYIDEIDKLTFTFGGKTYEFLLKKGDDGKLSGVTLDGKDVDLPSFRYTYVSLISMTIKGEYSPGDGEPAEVLRVKVDGASKSPEMVFYRVTTSKAYYTIDGQGKYYVLLDTVNTVKYNVQLLSEGKTVSRS